jgi:ketosteroid isomerase-like protein
MSRENVELVRGYVDAINHGDWAATLAASLHEDVEIDWSRSPAPYKGIYHGRQEAMRFAEALDVWEGARLDPSEFIDAGDDVLVPHVFHLRGRDGIEVTVRATYVFTIRDGLCARWAIYQEHAAALEAAGLSE